MRRGKAEADKLSSGKYRHGETDVRAMRRAVIRRVVNDHVALFKPVAAFLEEAEDALHVAGNGTQLQGRRKRSLADLAPVHVGRRGAQVFRLANDRVVAHSRQLAD